MTYSTPSYPVQLAGGDVANEPEDLEEAMYTLGTAPAGSTSKYGLRSTR